MPCKIYIVNACLMLAWWKRIFRVGFETLQKWDPDPKKIISDPQHCTSEYYESLYNSTGTVTGTVTVTFHRTEYPLGLPIMAKVIDPFLVKVT
jgi:hypothetical protein